MIPLLIHFADSQDRRVKGYSDAGIAVINQIEFDALELMQPDSAEKIRQSIAEVMYLYRMQLQNGHFWVFNTTVAGCPKSPRSVVCRVPIGWYGIVDGPYSAAATDSVPESQRVFADIFDAVQRHMGTAP